jgi:hypothetical protein
LKCIPNEGKQRLQSARDEFFKLVNDLQQDHPSKKSSENATHLSKNLAGDYDDQQPAAFVAAHHSAAQPLYAVLPAPALTLVPGSSPAQPPEA